MVARRCWPKAIFSRWRSNSRRAVSSKERAAEARDATPPSPPTGPFPPFVRPSIRLAPRGVILGHCRRSHCEIPHLSSATVASLDSSRASKRSEEREGEDTRKPHEAREGENSLTSSGVASEELFRRGIITPLMTAGARREEGKFGGFGPVFFVSCPCVVADFPEAAYNWRPVFLPRSAPKLPDGDFSKLAPTGRRARKVARDVARGGGERGCSTSQKCGWKIRASDREGAAFSSSASIPVASSSSKFKLILERGERASHSAKRTKSGARSRRRRAR